MQTNCRNVSSQTRRGILRLAVAVAIISASATALAQQSNKSPCANPNNLTLKTIYLTNASEQNDANEILVALRNMLDPCIRIYFVSLQNAIVLDAPADQIAMAEKLVQDLDRPKKTYRLTFTLTEFDGTSVVGTRHYTLALADGQRVTMKQGEKIPVVTGKYESGASLSQTQNTYLDVGMNFDATLTSFGNGLQLKSKVEQSTVGSEKSGIGPQDPVVHQTVLEGVTTLTLGKPLTLGTLELPDTQRHTEISVVAEPVS
jgi:type II secretory pathway component GspD/PulD (secretin)